MLLVEELGFHIGWLSDHLKPTYDDPDGPCLDGWTLIARLASVIARAGAWACSSPMLPSGTRPPLVSQVITADHLSDGKDRVWHWGGLVPG